MKAMHRLLAACVVAMAATACTGVRAPQHYFVLAPASGPLPATVRPALAAKARPLLVTPTTAAGFYDGQAIAYSAAPGMRAYYQLNHWTEPPSRLVGTLLAERLRSGGAFGTVVTATGSVRGALVLDTHLDEIYHDVSARPGSARIALTATLSDPAQRAVLAQRRFTAMAPAPTPDAAGAVQASGAALGTLLDEVAAWAGQAASESHLPERIANLNP